MNRVLVTGAAGFIGQAVASCLISRGRDVVGIGRGLPPAGLDLAAWNGEGVTLETLRDCAEGVEEIYHCAGSGSVAMSLQCPDKDFACNVVTTQVVLEFARQQGGPKVVLLSSAGVYGTLDEMPIRIDSPLKPISPYGVNKVICELLIRQYAQHFSVPATIVRLFSVYGEGLRKQLLWDAGHRLLRGDGTFFGTGTETRDWIHVDDAARLIVAAGAAARADVSVINGGTGRAVAIRTIVEGLAARLGGGCDIRFDGQVRAGDPQHYEADIAQALATGWRAEVGLEEGLDRYVDWLKRTVTGRETGDRK
ncbi:NAD-dependent epimerase/dehydratase family protein [Zavarzinia compransoris]|uniref:UDP-glucose 4-epimerase n=1 Tax=Zavarzinia compransoris TaxID=1264899 RepID=A0A317DWG8_9PROT|nr:NAD-dependent epimerase/dehydratase family protein [Zavarzinia compransoris]PWR18216.1 UDP-glucose 4-epimerase [Zavarzinia compransoris]TDP40892.1 UDP-glucose 4-epimerase [Zavarzinia compransoris]